MHGDSDQAGPFLELVRKVYPDNAAARRLYEGLGYVFEAGGEQLVGTYPLRRAG